MAAKWVKHFKPEHFPLNAWDSYVKNGYKLQRYLALPLKVISTMNAKEFLLNALDILMSTDSTENSSCVAAKIFIPSGQVVCLRLDRDYYEIYVKDSEGISTITSWQFTKCFDGFSQEELWCNMVNMALNFCKS